MAQVPYSEGVQSVEPRGAPPEDYQRIQATPEMFGGQIATGLQKLGAGETIAAKFFGHVAANDVWNDAADQATKLLHGDPNKTVQGPDGKPMQDTGYFGLEGRAQLNARPQVEQQLDEIIKNARGKLQTPDQELEFDTISRRYRQYWAGDVGTAADKAAKSYYAQVANRTLTEAKDRIARNANDPAEVQHAIADMARTREQATLWQGGTDDDLKAANAQARKDGVQTWIRAVAAQGDFARAQRMIQKNKDDLGTDADALYREVRAGAQRQNGLALEQQAARDAFGQGAPAHLPAPVQLPEVNRAILQQESGDKDFVPVSMTGAVGPGQIEPATFKQYALPGERISNPTDNRAVAGRILADYYQRYGGDPYRIAVAYFSGPNNVAPAGSPTPWLSNKADPTGKTVASYVNDVALRLGAPPASPQAYEAAVFRQIVASGADEETQQVAFQKFKQRMQDWQIASETTARAQKDAANAAAGKYTTQLTEAQPTEIQQILHQAAHDPALQNEPGAFRALYEFAQKVPGYDGVAGLGPDYATQYHRLFLNADDPNRLSSPAQIWMLADKDSGANLTPKGVEGLMKAFTESRKHPDQAELNKALDAQLQLAKDSLVLDQYVEGEPITRDLEGMKKYEQFVNAYTKSYAKFISDPKANPWDFLTDAKREELMKPYQRTPRQMYSDTMNPNAKLTPDQLIDQAVKANPQAQSGAVPKRDAEVEAAVALYKAGRITYDQARQLNQARGWGFELNPPAPAATKGPQPEYAPGGDQQSAAAAYFKTLGALGTDPNYDYVAARAAGLKPDEHGHMPDTYKLPNHITFSDESKYSSPEHQGGHWKHIEGNHWEFTPGPENLKYHSIQELRDYFKQMEPESTLIAPQAPQVAPELGNL